MTPTTADHVSAYWSRQYDALQAGLAAIRAGDLAAVHPTRVAIRRLRSTIRTFGDLLEPAPSPGLDPELRQLAVELGEVRDRQVLRILLTPWPGVADDVRDAVLARLDAEIELAFTRVRRAAEGDRVAGVVGAVGAISGSRPAGRGADEFRGRAARQVTRRFQRADTVRLDPARLHAVRKAVKRARYASEVFPDDESARLDALRFEELQEVLGRAQDLALAASYVAVVAESLPSTRGLGAAAWVDDLRAHAEAASREAFAAAASSHTYPAVAVVDESA